MYGHLWYKFIHIMIVMFWLLSRELELIIWNITFLIQENFFPCYHLHTLLAFCKYFHIYLAKLPSKTNSSRPSLYARKYHLWHFCAPYDSFTNTMLDKGRTSKTNLNPSTNITYHCHTFEAPIFVTLVHSLVSSPMMVLGRSTLEVNKFNASMVL